MAVLGRRPIAPVGDQIAPGSLEEHPVGGADRIDGGNPAAVPDRKPNLNPRYLNVEVL